MASCAMVFNEIASTALLLLLLLLLLLPLLLSETGRPKSRQNNKYNNFPFYILYFTTYRSASERNSFEDWIIAPPAAAFAVGSVRWR